MLSESEVFHLITASSKKFCPLDPIPTKLLTEYIDELLPSITKNTLIIRLILVTFGAPSLEVCSSKAAAKKGWITPCL